MTFLLQHHPLNFLSHVNWFSGCGRLPEYLSSPPHTGGQQVLSVFLSRLQSTAVAEFGNSESFLWYLLHFLTVSGSVWITKWMCLKGKQDTLNFTSEYFTIYSIISTTKTFWNPWIDWGCKRKLLPSTLCAMMSGSCSRRPEWHCVNTCDCRSLPFSEVCASQMEVRIIPIPTRR